MSAKPALSMHLYIDTIGLETPAKQGVFYSRRGGGPYYRTRLHPSVS